VCVPVEVSKVDEFEPTAVPTVGQLLRELDRPTHGELTDEGDEATKKADPGEPTRTRTLETEDYTKSAICHADYSRTSLKPYIDLFERHVTAVMRDNREAKKVDNMDKVSMEF
jgi:DNA primase small subunit